MKDHPDHNDANLVLTLYELRREAVMRESRHRITRDFWPHAYEDVFAVVQPDHPLNAAWRQTSSYWEMAFGMAHHGIAHAEYLVENCGEGLLLYAKVEPHLERMRKELSPTVLRHAEWAARETESGRRIAELFRGRIRAQLAKTPA